MNKTFYLHLGYPKTGTTFLQREIFRNTKELIYLGKSDSHRDATTLDLMIDEIRIINHNTFKNNISSYISQIKSITEKYTESKKFIYSNEVLLQQLFCRNFTTVVLIERLLQILRLADVKVRLLATDRNKRDLILSWYSEAPHHFSGYCTQWDSFESFKKSLFLKTADKRVTDFIDSLKLEQISERLSINSDDFLILSFECFQRNPTKYYKQLFTFMGIREIDTKIKQKPINPSIIKDGRRIPKKYQMTIPELLVRLMPYSVKKNLSPRIKKNLIKFRNSTQKFFVSNKFMLALANFLENIFLKKQVSKIYFTDSEIRLLDNIFKN